MPKSLCYTLHVTLGNQRAVKALAKAAEFIAEQAEGQEWNKDAQRALKAVRYACKHLTPEVRHP